MDSDGESSKSPIPKIDQSERMCVSCGCPIRDRYVMKVTPDLHWHITCLACAECGKQLDEKITCFVKGGKTYCKEDYFRTRGIICRKCTEPFNESDFVMRVDQVIYHAHCFTCSMCQVRLRTGDQFYLDDNGHLFCIKDYEMKADGFVSTTANLSDHISTTNNNKNNNSNNNNYNNMAAACEDEDDAVDDYPLLNNKTQHWNGCSSNSRESFCCSEGSFAVPLVQGEGCKSLSYNKWTREQPCQSYSVEQLPLPQRHHATTSCDVDFYNCNGSIISPHATTTTPTTANCQISPSISSPTCNDYETFATPTAGDYKDFSRNCSNYYKSYTTNQNSYYKHQPNSLYSDNNNIAINSNNNPNNTNNTNSNSNSNNRTAKPKSDSLKSKAGSKNACDAQPHKTTRIRTVLNEKQLHMLKTCYAANPRPDALMKDQLVEMTGLNSRVIRVWFQNKRCKDKKRSIQLKQVRQCNQDKMKNMGMITIASPTIQSEHSPNIGTSSLDSDKFIGPPSMTHSNGDWADYSSYGMNRRTYHSNNPVSSGLTDDPLYRLEGLNCNAGLGGQYQLPDQSQLIPRHQTPPIQQLLNSFGSNRVGPPERKHPYPEFSAKAKLSGKPGTRNEDCPGNPDHVVDSGNSNNHNVNNNNNNNNNSKGYSFDGSGES